MTGRKVIPMPEATEKVGVKIPVSMDRFAMMRQINKAQQSDAPNPKIVAQNNRQRRADEAQRREEKKLMAKEDYTSTPEGEIRLKQRENRLLMQEEENRMRKLIREEKEQQLRIQEQEKKEREQQKRAEMLEMRKREMEALKKKQEQEELEKKKEREEKMRKLKEESDARARARLLAKQEAAEAEKRAEMEKEQQIINEQAERETMTLEEEYEKHRLKREQEALEIRQKIEAEELKWKEWEMEEERREAEALKERRKRLAAQYEADKKRKLELHKLKQEKEQRSRKKNSPLVQTDLVVAQKIDVNSQSPNNRQSTISLKSPDKAKNTPKKSILVGSHKDQFDSFLAGLNTITKLKAEQKNCVGQKRKTKLKIKSWCDEFQNKHGREATVSDKEAIQPLYQTFNDLDTKLKLVKEKIEMFQVKEENSGSELNDSSPQKISSALSKSVESNVSKTSAMRSQPVANADHTVKAIKSIANLEQEKRIIVKKKRKLKNEIQKWCQEFEHANQRPANVEDKNTIQHLYVEYKEIDQTLNEIKSELDILMANDKEVSSTQTKVDSHCTSMVNTKLNNSLPEESDCTLGRTTDTTNEVSSVAEVEPEEGTAKNEPSPENSLSLDKNQSTRLEEISQMGLSDLIELQNSCDIIGNNELSFTIEHCIYGYEETPFALVQEILPDSPAEHAGLQNNDYILRIGDIVSSSIDDREHFMLSLSSLVERNINREISISVQRWMQDEYKTILVMLCPQKWNGNGLIGCSFSSCNLKAEENLDTDKVQTNADNSNEVSARKKYSLLENAFAFVEKVFEESPANISGLQEGDLIISFGHVDHTSGENTFENISEIVLNDHSILICVKRWDGWNFADIQLSLTPSSNWEGNGRLGCQIVPWVMHPFACITNVKSLSPAEEAGLTRDDYILNFGKVNALNSNNLQGLIEEVSNNVGAAVAVVVKRFQVDGQVSYCKLTLIPHPWEGDGVLGCDIVPYECDKDDVLEQFSPFLVVDSVAENSPAAESGLAAGDLILKFGSIDCRMSNCKDLSQLAQLVNENINTEIGVCVQRWGESDDNAYEEVTVKLVLTPHEWEGSGMLGCNLCPWDDEDIDLYSDNQAYEVQQEQQHQHQNPFLVIDSVLDNSPAHQAGLLNGDLVVSFGGIEFSDENLTEVVELVKCSLNKSIKLDIQRWEGWDCSSLVLDLIPKKWEGNGILGCDISTYDDYCAKFDTYNSEEYLCEECINTDFTTSAHAAAYSGHQSCLEYLSNYFDVFFVDDKGRTSLFYACYCNQLDCISFLLSIGGYEWIDAGDNDGETPLHAATSAGALNAAQLLLENEANINSTNNQLQTPCHNVANAQVLSLLINYGADVLATDSTGKLPLHYACAADAVDCVAVLCNVCPEFIDYTDDEGNTPLHVAASWGFTSSVSKICEYASPSMDINLSNHDGLTANDIALKNNHVECSSIILGTKSNFEG